MRDRKNKCSVAVNGKTYPCPISMAMDLIGGKWKGVILYYLKDGKKRFSELKNDMPEITEMTLSLQLKKLEKSGFILRTVYGEKAPIKVVYQLTEFGESFKPVLDTLSIWAHKVVMNAEN
ncbi:helix-turn-helix transcriptional regulator [Acinetobacter qingfengensis]|uniref:Transcriptional regulator n=1 Tax=Acinetobacter qingfengensis TaxID=1262585 RepID=A0A1E7RD74_9GAMM|nr:helix-turn-helix domain-containing protein [Acinetobacter qingfengensis]KAA8732163.1 helix-turn-helix transcriptional regulator [Acinetobacter qingfengensis]OEY97243.1 transcriptional regulator [Acinetobacter qingfengensis]